MANFLCWVSEDPETIFDFKMRVENDPTTPVHSYVSTDGCTICFTLGEDNPEDQQAQIELIAAGLDVKKTDTTRID